MSQLLQQAVAAHQAGNMAEAEKLYRAALAENPAQADACALLGVVVGARGDFAEAIAWVDKAVTLDPKAGLLHFHRGTVLLAAQKGPAAIAALLYAAQLQPGVAQIHFNLANALRASGDWPGAIAHYREALRLDPRFLEAYNNLALSLVHEKYYDEALDFARRAVELNAAFGDGWLTLCNVAEKLKDYDLALRAGERARILMPQNHFAWFGYGVALNRVGRDADAISAYQRALALNPTRSDILDNLAQTYQSLNRLEEAEQTFRKAVEVAGQVIEGEDVREVDESEYGNRHWHLALIELLRGKYKSGFARYRSRFTDIKELKRLSFSFPLWKGEPLQGKTLLVCDEQGYGDTLMLARFLPVLRQQGARVVFLVHKVLVPLFTGWDGADLVLPHGGQIPPCDYFCSSFDLPHRLNINLENLPHEVPYLPILPPDPALQVSGAKPKIGIVWGGSPLHLNDQKRSVPLPVFADLFTVPDVSFYSFNRDLKPGDAEMLPHYKIENLVPHLTDFAKAARLVDQMDLMIVCDTANAHLAGGMGKKVWVLLPFAPDWRWLTGRDDSPWYPTARLFRQPAPGDWAGAVAAVKQALLQESLPSRISI
ncbi:MAG: tetratricopeptide repeat protein [Alphaproteobacteria bacterium]|nr:tetratricopeptide repeat protein [Alphaproteobacteria bacterium]